MIRSSVCIDGALIFKLAELSLKDDGLLFEIFTSRLALGALSS